jgi:iron complex outermembrane receptor protein
MRIFPLIGLMTFALSTPFPAELFAQAESAKEEKPAQQAVRIEETQVTAEREPERGYGVQNATSATKTDTPLLETPQAISVVPRALLEDQGALKLDDVLKNVAGVSHGGYYGEWDYYRIRGFNASFYTYLDGLLGGLYNPNEELWGLERVEVVKGPASTLYGQGPAGGFVSLISKRPRPDFFGETRFTTGSFNFYEAAFDVNAPLTKEGNVYGRLNALYRQKDSFVDFADARRCFIAPSLTWEITPDTALTLLTSVTDDHMDFAFPLPARGTVLPNPNGEIPTSRYIGNPGAGGNDEWERLTRLGYEFRHRCNEHLSFRNQFRYERHDWTSDDLAYPSFLEDDDRTLQLSGWLADGEYQGYRADSALDARLETGPIEHTLTGGIDYRRTEQKYIGRTSTNEVTLDVFAPDYDAMPNFLYGEPFTYDFEEDDVGVYVQEHARWQKFTLTLGGRFDWSSSGNDSAHAFSPRAGLTYEFVNGLAAYASYSRSFEPQWGFVAASGDTVAPAIGENFEVGRPQSCNAGRAPPRHAVALPSDQTEPRHAQPRHARSERLDRQRRTTQSRGGTRRWLPLRARLGNPGRLHLPGRRNHQGQLAARRRALVGRAGAQLQRVDDIHPARRPAPGPGLWPRRTLLHRTGGRFDLQQSVQAAPLWGDGRGGLLPARPLQRASQREQRAR